MGEDEKSDAFLAKIFILNSNQFVYTKLHKSVVSNAIDYDFYDFLILMKDLHYNKDKIIFYLQSAFIAFLITL